MSFTFDSTLKLASRVLFCDSCFDVWKLERFLLFKHQSDHLRFFRMQKHDLTFFDLLLTRTLGDHSLGGAMSRAAVGQLSLASLRGRLIEYQLRLG